MFTDVRISSNLKYVDGARGYFYVDMSNRALIFRNYGFPREFVGGLDVTNSESLTFSPNNCL